MGDLYGLAVALRTDRADVASYASVLTDALGSALPEGMVEVERDRSMKDRLAGRPGDPGGRPAGPRGSPCGCTEWTGSSSCGRPRAGSRRRCAGLCAVS